MKKVFPFLSCCAVNTELLMYIVGKILWTAQSFNHLPLRFSMLDSRSKRFVQITNNLSFLLFGNIKLPLYLLDIVLSHIETSEKSPSPVKLFTHTV